MMGVAIVVAGSFVGYLEFYYPNYVPGRDLSVEVLCLLLYFWGALRLEPLWIAWASARAPQPYIFYYFVFTVIGGLLARGFVEWAARCLLAVYDTLSFVVRGFNKTLRK